jgi:cytochrome c oxidase subunit 1
MKIKRLLSVFILLLAMCILPHLLIWIHHRLVFGLNPFVGPVVLIIIFLASTPFIIKYYRWLRRQWFERSSNEPFVLFAIGALCLLISCIISGNASVDIHLHDTYYIISYFSIVVLGSFLFGIFCTFYYLFPRIFRRDLNISLSRFHFWITYIGLNLLFSMFSIRYTDQIINEPRRYVEYSGWASYQHYEYFNRNILITVILVLAAQILFIFNIINSLIKENKSGT